MTIDSTTTSPLALRERQSIDRIHGVTMMVRVMRGIGAMFERFEPHSLDTLGAMLVLRGKVDSDAPLRVYVNVVEPIAQLYSEDQNIPLEELKQNKDGTYQLFGNWLKVKWTRVLDDFQLEMMGANKQLWEIHDRMQMGERFPVRERATYLLENEITTNIEVIMVLKAIEAGQSLDFEWSQEGIRKLARIEAELNLKYLYVLLAGYRYGDILKSTVSFKERYTRDPFQKRYGVLHGTMALNQGDEDWAHTFDTLQRLADKVNA